MSTYHQLYQSWKQDPEGFWADQAKAIDWTKPFDQVLDQSKPPFARWFTGGECNTAYNCLDRHVEAGRGDQTALIYDSPITGAQKKYTYQELTDAVALFAGALANQGVTKGDRVLIYMPMVPEAAIAMLATARIGAVHSVVFGGFSSEELAKRIDDATPKLVVSASCGIEPSGVVKYKPLIDGALEIAKHKVEGCIILQREQETAPLAPGRDLDWQDALASATPHDCVPVAATDPLYVLYTSGTTGKPKGVVRDNGGHMVALHWSMEAIYGVKQGEVFWAASDVGWVVGHSYIVYGPLLKGCTTILFEGKPVGTPDAGTFWRVIEEHKVSVLFTAPTAFRAIKREDPDAELLKGRDLSGFRALFLAGERADPDTIHWAEDKLKVPVIDHWWQTETGWSVAANPMGLGLLPVKYGSPAVAMPGYEIAVVHEESHEVMAPGEIGAIVIKLPLPPGALPSLWNNDEGFKASYLEAFPGYYQTGDAGYVDEDGYVYVMARTDDIINVAGHRLSTGGMEEVVAEHPDVAECAVIGVADTIKGQIPMGFVCLKAGASADHAAIEADLIKTVRTRIGPVAAFKKVLVVQRLPKTRSGKILRRTMRAIADQTEWSMPATIDDPQILDEIAQALRAHGFIE